MSNPPSITTAKTTFIRSQIRLLSTPLPPPSQPQPQSHTLSPTDDSSPAPLPPKVLADLTSKLNAKIKAHNRLVFSVQSQRHVAEQIDTLYWNEITGSTATRTRGGDGTVWIARDVDLSAVENLALLPEELGEEEEGESEYRQARERAAELARRRDEIRMKVQALRELRRLLGPFEDVKGNVQRNLVTRDGELAREVERMKVLIARVEAGLDREREVGKGRVGGEVEEGVQSSVRLSDQQKLAVVMDLC